MTLDVADGEAMPRAQQHEPQQVVGARPGDPAGGDRSAWALVAAISAAAFAIGCVGLASRSLWMDEAMTVGATRNLLEALVSEGSSMGPYFALLRPWSEISTATWWLRVPSLLFAVATIPVTFAIGRRIGSRRFATIAAALLATSWLWLRYGQEARAYSMVMLVGAVSWYALVRAVQVGIDGDRRWWRLYAAASVLAVLTHGLGILQLGAQLALLLVIPDWSAWVKRAMPVVVACGLAMMAMILPGAVVAPQWVEPLSLAQLHQLLAQFTGPTTVAQVALGLLVLVGAVLRLRRVHRRPADVDEWLHLLPVGWAVLPIVGLIVLSVKDPVLVPRYVIGTAPAVALLGATALDAISSRALRTVAIVATLALLLAGQASWLREAHDDFVGPADHIAAEAEPGDGLFLPNPFVRPQLDYQWLDGEGAPDGLVPMVPLDPIGSLPRFYEVPDVSDEELADLLVATDVERVWILDQEAHGLRDKVPDLEAHPPFAEAFRRADVTMYDGGLTLYLFVRR
jgi:mannosyltransferase